MTILLNVLLFIVLFLLLFVVIYFCNKYIFRKVRVNKYIPLSLALVCIVVAIFIRNMNMIANLAVTFLAVIFFAWFFDINQGGQAKIEKKIKIKPKAKPNRVKNQKNHIEKK